MVIADMKPGMSSWRITISLRTGLTARTWPLISYRWPSARGAHAIRTAKPPATADPRLEAMAFKILRPAVRVSPGGLSRQVRAGPVVP